VELDHRVASAGATGAAQERAPARRCVRHPSRETLVACGRCGRPFCPECLLHTPAGQRCYECAGVRRRSAEVMAGQGLLKALGIVMIGSAIGAFAGPLFGVIIAAFTGGFGGQALSPSVNRRTRGVMTALALLILIAGALAGRAAVQLAIAFPFVRASAGASDALLPLYLVGAFIVVALGLLQSWSFWLFVLVAGIVGYQRLR
jgi:hypothetical protein